MKKFRRSQKSFRWNTAPIKADASEVLPLNHRGLDAKCQGNRVTIMKDDDVICTLDTPSGVSSTKERFSHSRSYGVLEDAWTIFISKQVDPGESTYRGVYTVKWEK